VFKLTQEKMDEYAKELKYLRTEREREVADQIREARAFGDLSENSEYDEAKNEQGRLYARIAELENILQNAVLLTAKEAGSGVMTGSHVTVRDLDTAEEIIYYMVGSQEANPMEQRISDESPFGKALLGRAVGDEVKFNAPAGPLRFEIVAIN
jgi:transcription elongation factor GreA